MFFQQIANNLKKIYLAPKNKLKLHLEALPLFSRQMWSTPLPQTMPGPTHDQELLSMLLEDELAKQR